MGKKGPKLEILLQSVVRRFSLGLNLLSLYPPYHPEVKAGVNILLRTLEPYFLLENEFIIGIGAKGWIIKDIDLTKENLQFGGSARELHRRGISAILFHEGIEEETLLKFFQIAVLPIEKIEERGGLLKMASEFKLPHINLFKLDYSKLIICDDSAEFDAAEFYLERDHFEEIVQAFTLEGEENNSDEYKAEAIALSLNHVFKNAEKEHIEAASSLIKSLGTRCLKEQMMHKNKSAEKFVQLVSQLNPEFIKKVADSIKRSPSEESMQFSAEEKEYDPFRMRMLNLFNSFTLSAPEDDRAQSDQLLNLFEKTDNAVHSSEAYKIFINHAVDRTSAYIRDPLKEQIKRESYLKEMDSGYIKAHALKVILDLLETEKDAADYEKILTVALPYITFVAQEKNDSLLNDVLTILERHSNLKENEKIREMASEYRDSFFSGPVIYDILERYFQGVGDILMKEKMIMRLNRSMIITELRLMQGAKPCAPYHEKISAVLSKVVNEVSLFEEDLKASDDAAVLNALDVLKAVSSEQAAELMGPLLNHPSFAVRMKTFEALVQHSTQKSLLILLTRIQKLEDRQYEKLIEAIAMYGLKEVIQKLYPFLSASDFFGKSYHKRLKMLSVLGRYKNKYCVPLLTELFSLSPFLFKRKNNSFRAAVLNTLASVGTEEALIAVSLLSKKGDTIIRLTGNILLQQKEEHGR